jgi:hypothetical protein
MGTAYSRPLRLSPDRIFFGSMALAMLATMFAGFAPTYYLMRLTGAPALSPLLHLHGILFTSWFLLFFAQTSLIAARRTDLHRRLGYVGAMLALLLVLVGATTAISIGRLGLGRGAFTSREFLAFPFSILLLFVTLAGLALWKRRDPGAHKRLMLLASLSMLVPAISRLRVPLGLPGPITGMLLSNLFLLAACAYDWRRLGRVHPALFWGGTLFLVSQPLRWAVAKSAVWDRLAASLIG